MGQFLQNLALTFLDMQALFTGLLYSNSEYQRMDDEYPGNESRDVYSIVIDAGSTGSRVITYKFRISFRRNVFGPPNLELVDVITEKIEPGLSEYADDPEKGAKILVDLIKRVEHFTPAEKRRETPILLRATSGLRLLPEKDAQLLLRSVEEAISGLGYNTDNSSVEILDSAYEGIYLWHAVNLLYGTSKLQFDPKLSNGESFATLDLGGGSAQITYQLSKRVESRYPPSHQFPEIRYPEGKNVTLYSHSYLGLGKMESRRRILKQEMRYPRTNKVKSVCVHPNVRNLPFTWMKEEISVSGAKRNHLNPKAVYKRCHDRVKRYVLATLDWEPSAPPRGRVVATASFFKVAKKAGLIDDSGGTVSVSQYREAALAACSVANEENPWACADLVYVITVLHDAYKIPNDEPIKVILIVDKFYLSWAIGLAYTNVLKRLAQEQVEVERTIKSRAQVALPDY